MQNTYKIIVFLISCMAAFFASIAFGVENKDINEQIKELEKKIQRAADVEAIKRVMSSMQYGSNSPATAVKKTLGACFGENAGYKYGAFMKRDTIKDQEEMKSAAEGRKGSMPADGGKINAVGAPGGGQGEEEFASTSRGIHMLTNTVIEIAEDGQTAKAVWYSPGQLYGGDSSTWAYEMYACDFVKEDGVWKSWHRTVANDFNASLVKGWTDVGQSSEASGHWYDVYTVHYKVWSTATLPQYKPKPPVPYKTFSETFSYCPPMPKDLEEQLKRENLMFE